LRSVDAQCAAAARKRGPGGEGKEKAPQERHYEHNEVERSNSG
jgi:hypothetical protein